MPFPEPRTPAAALAVFLAGCVVVAATTLDVARRMRANATPPTEEALAQLAAYKRALDAQAAQTALARAAGEAR